MFKITKPDNESILSKESSEVTISSNEGQKNNNENILAELSNSVYSNQLPEINESSIFPSDMPSTPADQNENLNLNNESIVVDEFEYHYKHELDTNNVNEQEDLTSTRHRSSSLQDTNLANDSILSLKSNTSTESASVSKSPVSQISDILSNKDDTNVNKVEETLARSESSSSSSSSSSTDSNDWLDVQKAINEYQKLNLDEDYNDNEILSVHDDVNTDKEVFVPVDLALSSSDKPIEVVKSGGKGDGGDDSSSSSDEDENETNRNNNRKDEDGSNKDNKPSNFRANYMVDSMDDVIIDCKVDYRIRNEDSDSSITDTMSSSMVSERRNSEYDNLNSAGTAQATVIELGKKEDTNPLVSSSSASLVDVDGAALSTSINSVASLDNNNPNNNANNETLPSFTSITSNEFLNKSCDDEEEETVEYSFVEDFTDLSKELDDNWIQDDDVWFGSSVSQKPLANTTTTTTIPVSMHPPRLLHRIEEEESSLSVETEFVEVASSSETLKLDQANNNELIIDAPEKYAHLLDNVEEFKMTLEYEFKQDAKQALVIIEIFSLISIRIKFKIFVLIRIFNSTITITIISIFCPISLLIISLCSFLKSCKNC